MSTKPLCQPIYRWKEIPSLIFTSSDGTQEISPRRGIFVGSISSETPFFVAKIETAEMRKVKPQQILPHAEEIAYKICKLLHWNTVPKTKVFHQVSLKEPSEKLQKYAELTKNFKSEKYPLTFTIQRFVEGKTLDEIKDFEGVELNLASYQKAYLLDMILGKFDARCSKTIFHPKTKELFEISNEYIGKKHYQNLGALNDYDALKSYEVDLEVLVFILDVSLLQIAEIRDKYSTKDKELIALWKKEPISVANDHGPRIRDKHWSKIMKNFLFLKICIRAQIERFETITLEKLEAGISQLHLSDKSSHIFFSKHGKTNYLHRISLFEADSHILEMIVKECLPMMEQKDSCSRTPLDWAISKKKTEVIELLLQYGAKVSFDNHNSLEDKQFEHIYALGDCSPVEADT